METFGLLQEIKRGQLQAIFFVPARSKEITISLNREDLQLLEKMEGLVEIDGFYLLNLQQKKIMWEGEK
ncbi:hypothetical protein [Listeria seeligeri]|uniref:hypothetical protein n=1 Tax=Listeria seeligeri TaxID=1640 RepID=UPI001625AB61|nr:hypothetical protein [Listeria seeligeri]MBC1746897.1 hypothetical protein [Listeria seeligeri]MBC2233036.1 hypothetical protein [Listeria seeligeri]MBF2626134.1 hypothetical protein [Listeria seeligeri]MBF2673472.1 hypothetical protein [Listeria seeligeri]